MAFGETADLVATLKLQDQFTGPLNKAKRGLAGFDAKLTNTQGRAYKAGQQIGTGIRNAAKLAVVGIGALTGLLIASAKEGQEALKVQQLYANAIAKSGKVSAAYVKALNAQQDALLELSGADDEAIKAAQTQLVTMGLTGKQILKLTPLALDLATATGKDLSTATLAVGKAAQGSTTALQRMGIILPKNADAVAELEKRFGGATKAISGGLDVRLKVLNERLANLREQAGIKLLPALTRIVDVVARKLVPAFGKLLDAILPGAIAGLDKLAAFLEGGGATSAITTMLELAKTAAPVLKAAAETTLTVIKTAVGLFASLPPEIQALAVAGLTINKLTGGLVTNLAGGLISAVISSSRGLMNVNAAVVNVNGAVAGPGGLAGAAGGGIGALGKTLLVGEAIGLGLLVNEVREGQREASTAQANALDRQTKEWLAKNPSRADLLQGLRGVEDGINAIQSNPLNVLVQGDALDKLRAMQSAIASALKGKANQFPSPQGPSAITGLPLGQQFLTPQGPDPRTGKPLPVSDNELRKRIQTLKDRQETLTGKAAATNKRLLANAEKQLAGRLAFQRTLATVKSAVDIGKTVTAAAIERGKTATVGALSGIRYELRSLPAPMVSVNVNVNATTVNKTTTIQRRYALPSGSRTYNYYRDTEP